MNEIKEKLLNFFNGDYSKLVLWMKTENPNFGNIKPVDIYFLNRKKFIKTVNNMLEGNFP